LNVYFLFRHFAQIKHTIAKLQAVVCSDGRFRVMREALHRCDPPCIPYLGMYLTDLSFIEEGTPDFTPERLLNFSKMRMVSDSDYSIIFNFEALNIIWKI
jgi:RasGEF domain